MEVGAATFGSIHGAEHAFSDSRERDPEAVWIDSSAFVEVHRHGRIVVRGNVAGRYVDIDGQGDAMGPDTGAGAIVGSLVGFAFGPPAYAVGVVAGAAVGGTVETSHVPKLDGAAFDAIREQVPDGSSAVVICGSRTASRAMFDALRPTAATLVHYRLSPGAEAELQAALTPDEGLSRP
jgi:uncharacterized membrane protein